MKKVDYILLKAKQLNYVLKAAASHIIGLLKSRVQSGPRQRLGRSTGNAQNCLRIERPASPSQKHLISPIAGHQPILIPQSIQMLRNLFMISYLKACQYITSSGAVVAVVE